MKHFFLQITCIILFLFNSYGQEVRETEGKTTCGGTERWAIKVLTDNLVNTVNFTPISTTVTTLANLNVPATNANTARYAGVEDKTYTITGNITAKRSEDDNDYHLVISDGTSTMITEIPDPVCSVAASSTFVNQYISCRNFVNANIASGNVLNVNLPAVVVTGVAFVDIPHGQAGNAPNNLELHPVLDIHFLDSSTNVLNFPPKLSVNISPNPFETQVHASINSSYGLSNCSIRLYNIYAAKVFEYDLRVKQNAVIEDNIDLHSLVQGVYIYRIYNNNVPIYDGKLVKQ